MMRSVWAGPGALALCLGLTLSARSALAAICVQIDEQRDGLGADERQSARTLFETALEQEHAAVAREGCGETWTLYHVRLGDSITVVVQSPEGSRTLRVNRIEDLPGVYSQISRSLLTNTAITNDSAAVDRRNVTSAQQAPERVRADAIWYAKLGYGVTPAAGAHAGPAFGFGRRWELDRFGIDLGFFNFLLYQGGSGIHGTSVDWVELGADYYFDPYANSTFFIGAGLSLGSHTVPQATGNYEGGGMQAKATLGYEMFRASTIRFLLQAESTLPFYRLQRTETDPVTFDELHQHTYAPNFTLLLGIGWGGRSE
jgi:hypothetical protein